MWGCNAGGFESSRVLRVEEGGVMHRGERARGAIAVRGTRTAQRQASGISPSPSAYHLPFANPHRALPATAPQTRSSASAPQNHTPTPHRGKMTPAPWAGGSRTTDGRSFVEAAVAAAGV